MGRRKTGIMSTPAGWYPQPDGQQRYWDGESWTENFAPGFTPETPTSVLPVTPAGVPSEKHPPAVQRNWFLRHKILTAIGAVLLLGIGSSLANGDGTKSDRVAAIDQVETSTAPAQSAADKAAAAQAVIDKAAADKVAADQAVVDQAAADKAAAAQAVIDKAAADKAAAAAKAAAAKKIADANRLTTAQENAKRKAESYLEMSGFSRSGLIEQLKFEGFSATDAEKAIGSMNVNWNTEADQSAKAYVDMSGFSRSGLIEQLKFEGFTSAQAAHGADSVGL